MISKACTPCLAGEITLEVDNFEYIHVDTVKVMFLWTGFLPVQVLGQVHCNSDCNEGGYRILVVVGQNDNLSQPTQWRN